MWNPKPHNSAVLLIKHTHTHTRFGKTDEANKSKFMKRRRKNSSGTGACKFQDRNFLNFSSAFAFNLSSFCFPILTVPCKSVTNVLLFVVAVPLLTGAGTGGGRRRGGGLCVLRHTKWIILTSFFSVQNELSSPLLVGDFLYEQENFIDLQLRSQLALLEAWPTFFLSKEEPMRASFCEYGCAISALSALCVTSRQSPSIKLNTTRETT